MIQLYIRQQLVDLDGVISMPITKQFDDMANPTEIRNALSKTISIPATPQNNRIFGNIWRIDHINGGLFDPSKREPFLLASNGTMVMTGYVKLQDVKQVNGNPRSYEICLFGGLGDFFYSLSGDNKDMKDVVLPNNNLSHTINAAAVINPPEGMKYFLCYQGKYDSFDSKQVYDSVSKTFTDLPEEQDEHQRNEFRSYYQRPAFAIKTLMEAIFEQSGFNVLVSELFKQTPYWLDTYLALMPSPKDGSVPIEHIGRLSAPAAGTVPDAGTGNGETFGNRWLGRLSVNNTGMAITFDAGGSDPLFSADGSINTSGIASSKVSYRIPVLVGGYVDLPNPYLNQISDLQTSSWLQAKFFDQNGNVVAASTPISLSQLSTVKTMEPIQTLAIAFQLASRGGTRAFVLDGSFPLPPGTTKLTAKLFYNRSADGSTGTDQSRIKWGFTTGDRDIFVSSDGGVYFATAVSSKIDIAESSEGRSNATVSYTTLIPQGISQLSFASSFFKLFGMIWEKDPITPDVSIKTRNEFFADYKIVDWTERIDLSKGTTTTPLNFDFRYGLLGWKGSKTARAAQYFDAFRVEYGTMKVATGYEFAGSDKEFLDKNIFVNAVISSEYDFAFNGRGAESNRDNISIPALFERKDAKRDKSTETMQLFFWDGERPFPKNRSGIRITDDSTGEIDNQLFCWSARGGIIRDTYPAMSRVKSGANGVYSLDFSKPQSLYYPATDADYPETATIYRRFWDAYLNERLKSDTRVMTCYVYITEAEFSTWKFNTFVKIHNTIWHVNKIENFDALKQQSTKVQLVRVNDIEAYINGQHL